MDRGFFALPPVPHGIAEDRLGAAMILDSPLSVEVKTSGRRARDVIGAWSWGLAPSGDVPLAVGEWVKRCAGATPRDGVAVTIRRAP